MWHYAERPYGGPLVFFTHVSPPPISPARR